MIEGTTRQDVVEDVLGTVAVPAMEAV